MDISSTEHPFIGFCSVSPCPTSGPCRVRIIFAICQSALLLQVEWNNNRDPTKGFKYLFLSDSDYTSIADRADTAVLKAEPFFAENGAQPMHLREEPCPPAQLTYLFHPS